MQYCCQLVDLCVGICVTGISEGVLMEVEHTLDTKTEPKIDIFPIYDPKWHDMLEYFNKQGTFDRAVGYIAALR